MPILLIAAVLAMCGTVTSCSSNKQLGTKPTNGSMYERQQSNRGSKVKSNIKVRGSNKSNGHTTRSY
ncbi:MAG: hypothetical protein J6X88_10465 [Bacteroidales bacterium]|nr:hypothetical protein [Bacteroidales bacterium]